MNLAIAPQGVLDGRKTGRATGFLPRKEGGGLGKAEWREEVGYT
jgi:hypothetical protein